MNYTIKLLKATPVIVTPGQGQPQTVTLPQAREIQVHENAGKMYAFLWDDLWLIELPRDHYIVI